MTIASVGALGNLTHSTSASSATLTTTTNALSSSGDLGLFPFTTDNISTTDGETNDHVSVTGGNGVWSKLFEWTNSNGAAAAGLTVSLWLFQSTGTNAIGTVFTLNLSGAVVDKAGQGHKFTVAAGNSLQLSAAAAGNDTDASTGYGSASHSGLASLARLYFRALGKEANTTTNITASTNFTRLLAMVRSRNNADAVTAHGEFRLNTSTGETSNPTLAVSGDTAAIFVALEEYTPSSGGPVGMASETDSALSLSAVQSGGVGLGSETDSALALSAVQVGSFGLAVETDAAFALTASELRGVGISSEADTALALSGVESRAFGLASETDSAFALGGVQSRLFGLALETDTAFALTAGGGGATVGLAIEADTALALSAVQAHAVGVGLETDAAIALSGIQSQATGLASESDAAFALTAAQRRIVGLSIEADAALALPTVQSRPVGLASETDVAFSLPGITPSDVGPAPIEINLRHRIVAVNLAHRRRQVSVSRRVHQINLGLAA